MTAEGIDFDRLTKRQKSVMDLIALGHWVGHHRQTIRVLLAKELITEHEESLPVFPFFVKQYTMPTHVHTAWCEWRSAKAGPEEGET